MGDLRRLRHAAQPLILACARLWRQPPPPPPSEAPFDILGPLTPARRRRLGDLLTRTPIPEGRTALPLRIAGVESPTYAKNTIFSLDDIGWPNSLRRGFFELADAVVTPSGFVAADGRLIFNNQRLPEGWMRGEGGGAPDLVEKIFTENFIHRFDMWRGNCEISLPPPAEMDEIDEPGFVFDSRLTSYNFAHLMHDTLVQAPTFDDCRAHTGEDVVPVLAGPGFAYPAMGEIFRRAVGPRAPLFTGRRFLKFRRLFVPTIHFAPSGQAIARGGVVRLRAKLAASLADIRSPVKRRLFISREDSGRGEDREPRFANADALERALGELGFEKIVVSRLGDAYLKTFADAEIIVGLHGAGLLNLALCAEPRVVEIVVPGYPDWESLRLFMDVGLGAPYRRVAMAAPENGVALYDVPAILEACRALLATPAPPCP
jgi:hypothetical protein